MYEPLEKKMLKNFFFAFVDSCGYHQFQAIQGPLTASVYFFHFLTNAKYIIYDQIEKKIFHNNIFFYIFRARWDHVRVRKLGVNHELLMIYS